MYDPKWLEFAVPYRNDTKQFRKCERYVSLAGPAGNGVRCAPEGFTSNTTEPCAGSWVFENGENTIGTEVRHARNDRRKPVDFASPNVVWS